MNEYESTKAKIIETFPPLKKLWDDQRYTREDRIQFLKGMQAELQKETAQKRSELAPLEDRIKALEGAATWFGASHALRLESNECSRLHKLIEASKAGRVLFWNGDAMKPEGLPWLVPAQPLVVQHDWAAAFANATDYDEGGFNLPYSHTAFEFRISGRTVIVAALQPDEETLLQAGAAGVHVPGKVPAITYIELERGYWFCGGGQNGSLEGEERPVKDFAWNQIRAICIALDAEVATSHDVVRAPLALNEKRLKRGDVPLYDYHVIKLRGREKRLHLPSMGGTHRSPRLHFRRGHWRHYETHRTWIKWMLVGDPDLGFIDKSYRL